MGKKAIRLELKIPTRALLASDLMALKSLFPCQGTSSIL
jgi:hypothetical protein